MQKREGALDRGPSAVRDVRDRTADEMPRTLGDREKIWVFCSKEFEYRKGRKVLAYQPCAIEARHLLVAREIARREGAQLVEFPRGIKPNMSRTEVG